MADYKPSTRAIPRIQKIWDLRSAILLRVGRGKLRLYGTLEGKDKLPARKGAFRTALSFSSPASQKLHSSVKVTASS